MQDPLAIGLNSNQDYINQYRRGSDWYRTFGVKVINYLGERSERDNASISYDVDVDFFDMLRDCTAASKL